jgi:hypothetical protein
MSIIIIDNFQVDISNPIDNRFVVGSQSIPSGPNPAYPTPFYKYKDDIVYKYPGLRIWDFNDNVPYVWDGTQWINENTTGALVQNAATGNTGFQNYVTKFANNTTLLTKSLLFDNLSHIGLGLTTPNPGSIIPGLHVLGNIKTNNYFVGNGSLITNIHAPNITTGYLDLARIYPPNPITPGLTYLLKNISGVTSWDLLTAIMPFTSATNLTLNNTTANIANLSTGNVYQGISVNQTTGEGTLQFKQLVSTGLQIDNSNSDNIRIESKQGYSLGTITDGEAIYDGLDTDKIHKFKRIKSSSLQVTQDGSNSIKIEIPASFEGTDYYVNGYYSGVELGTRSKPFSSLKNCLDKILNRGTFNDPNINSGLAYEKWEVRTGPNATKPSYLNAYASSLPGGGAIRVIIQSYVEAYENLAIQGVTYFLEKGGYSSHIVVTAATTLDAVTGQPFEYLFDTRPLVDGAPKGNPYYTTNGNLLNNNPGELDYDINCYLEGSGTISFNPGHPNRKGFIKHKATNSYDWLITNQPTNTTAIAVASAFPNQRVSYFTVGSVGGYISFNMSALPAVGVGTPATHISGTVSITLEDGSPFIREGIEMIGYQTTATPDYGVIQVEGRNSMFYQSMFFNGTLVLNANEQHMIYAKDYGSIYSDNGRIYMRRNYQYVVYQNIEYFKQELPHDTYYQATNGWYRIVSAGTTTAAQWNTLAGTIAGGSPGTWRTSAGVPLVGAPNYPTGSSSWVDLVFKSVGRNDGGPSVPALGTGTITRCSKIYMPSSYVSDIYLKNGSSLQHGGDFYTQQNTSATNGGPDAFVCLENSIANTGDTTHPNRDGRTSTFCEFNANGGGYITRLLYNYYIKTIMHPTYGNDQSHGVSLKNLKIDSSIYKSVIRAQNIAGSNWTSVNNGGSYKNCYMGNTIYGGTLILPISNMPIYNNDGVYTGKMVITGTTIDLPGGLFNPFIPIFSGNPAALAGGLSVGNIYRDSSGNLKMVIP